MGIPQLSRVMTRLLLLPKRTGTTTDPPNHLVLEVLMALLVTVPVLSVKSRVRAGKAKPGRCG